MATSEKSKRICDKGHTYYKSSACPTCPTCEGERKPNTGFLSLLAAPARRALQSNGITSLQELSQYSEKEILQLHGIGPSSLPKLKAALQENDLTFKE
ncbi:RNA polymerase alpha subunit C-terminal domain-containing protein [Lysinibacillus sp. KU-BSD001]|uniref:RNA polymerase alpha subunit C-terminal domain-containing protein n=1 Tax=Lysinibacillus sp. KU-BSD001 TaxID=3141328 RepID=UPI0036EB7B6A